MKESPCGLKCWYWDNHKDACKTCIYKPLTDKDIQEIKKSNIVVWR
jgi:hypothetical protein